MTTLPRRGEVWWAEQPDKRRPVLVLTRDAVIPVLRTLVVVPITTRVRDIPTHIRLDRDDGMPVECAAATDTITVTDRTLLTARITRLSAARMTEICHALATSVDCAFP